MYKIILFYWLKICRGIEKFKIFINSCLSWIMDIKFMRKIKESLKFEKGDGDGLNMYIVS